MESLVAAHDNYDYEKLCCELEEICKRINESVDDLILRVVKIYYRFYKNDKPSRKEFFVWYSYLLSIPKEDEQLLHCEQDT